MKKILEHACFLTYKILLNLIYQVAFSETKEERNKGWSKDEFLLRYFLEDKAITWLI